MSKEELNHTYFQNQKFTHLAFLNHHHNLTEPIIWNKIFNPSVFTQTPDRPSFLNVEFNCALSDKNVILDLEDKTKIFLLNESGQVSYVNIILFFQKKLQPPQTMFFQLILDNTIYQETLHYQFLFNKEYSFFDHHTHNIGFDYIEKVILIHDEAQISNKVELYFMAQQMNLLLNYAQFDSFDKKKKYVDFILELEHGFSPR
jgi:hypothetical protein